MIEIKFYASNTKYLKSVSVWILNWVLGLGRPIVVWTFYQVLNTVKSIEIKNILNVATKHLEYLAPSWQDLNVLCVLTTCTVGVKKSQQSENQYSRSGTGINLLIHKDRFQYQAAYPELRNFVRTSKFGCCSYTISLLLYSGFQNGCVFYETYCIANIRLHQHYTSE